MSKRAVLLVNLGSPDSTSVPDVRRYLREFLGDERVLDRPAAPLRWALLEGIILRSRPAKSGADTPVYLAMRYGNPSIASVIAQIAADGIQELLLFPQYPHYAMASWETVVVRVFEEIARQAPALKVTTVQPFYEDRDYIDALHAVVAPYLAQPFDHVLFSYHGLPERHMRKADSSHAHCLTVPDCCNTCSPAHATCYRAQVVKTTQALVRRANLSAEKHSLSFQSRLAGEPWLQPYTDHEFERLPQTGKKKLLVLCPAFVADCLETLEEIAIQGRESFLASGGESFTYIPCLNSDQAYIDFLANRVHLWLSPSHS
jgi:ferrochelatase